MIPGIIISIWFIGGFSAIAWWIMKDRSAIGILADELPIAPMIIFLVLLAGPLTWTIVLQREDGE